LPCAARLESPRSRRKVSKAASDWKRELGFIVDPLPYAQYSGMAPRESVGHGRSAPEADRILVWACLPVKVKEFADRCAPNAAGEPLSGAILSTADSVPNKQRERTFRQFLNLVLVHASKNVKRGQALVFGIEYLSLSESWSKVSLRTLSRNHTYRRLEWFRRGSLCYRESRPPRVRLHLQGSRSCTNWFRSIDRWFL
jgi:hypothetical protein